jgi:hypothetical protein
MTCNRCGAGVAPVDVDEPQEEGLFNEEYECDHGHKGFVSGREEQNPKQWERFGPVFDG